MLVLEGTATSGHHDLTHNEAGDQPTVQAATVFTMKQFAALLTALKDAGCRELTMEGGVPWPMKDDWRPGPGDEDLAVITSRRTTLELVIRRYVERMPGVTLHSNINVTGLLGAVDNQEYTHPRAKIYPRLAPQNRYRTCRQSWHMHPSK